MTFRTMMLTSAMTGSMAFAAFADTDTYSEKGHEIKAGDAAETSSVIDKDVYSENGQKIVTVGVESRTDADVIDGQDTWKRNEGAASTSSENILATAEPGTLVRAYNGETIGTVAYTTENDELGDVVFVNVAPEAGLPAELVGIQTEALQTVPNTEAIEYQSTMENLEREIINALSS
ncbi:MAG: hypothetical protein AAFZ04_02120 [Pseudomonadota bacterium]